MRAGDLRHRITFQSRSATRDALGGQSLTWNDVASVWADVAPLSGRELLSAQANKSDVSSMITIRWQAQFADPAAIATWRIVYGARIFNIHASIDVDERHKTIELSCGSGLNDG